MLQEHNLMGYSSIPTKAPFDLVGEKKIPKGIFGLGNEPLDMHTPLHSVEIKHDFYMMDTLLTQDLWKSIRGENPSNWVGKDLPVDRVSWIETVLFANTLSKMCDLETCYQFDHGAISFDGTKNGFRLPFEIEWEYAAKANTNLEYAGSDDYSDVAGHIDANERIAYTKTMPLKAKKPNAWGLYDMTGNLSEWCNDIFKQDAYAQRIKKVNGLPYVFDVSKITFTEDFLGCQEFTHKKVVVRGGSWFNSERHSKVYTRHFQNMMYPSSMVGIRFVRSILD